MINFFRKKRKNLADDHSYAKASDGNKALKYSRYAIGEILLVVIGILIALSINNWNNKKHQQKDRQELITSLINDFEASKKLIDSSIYYQAEVTSYTTFFIKNIYHTKNYSVLDSLQNNFRPSFFNRGNFNVITTTYKNAEANGKISLLEDKNIFYLFSDFFSNNKRVENYSEIALKMYYEGAIWELTKEIGSLSKLIEANNNLVTHRKEFIDLLNNPVVQSTLEIKNTYNYNMNKILGELQNNTKEILTRLYCLQSDKKCD